MNISQLYSTLDAGSLQELIRVCKAFSSINEAVLEKDLFLTGLLKKIMLSSPYKDYLYFKGGTALAKCHHVIDRFSEDIDLFVYSGNPGASKKQEDKLNGKVTHDLMDAFPNDVLPGGKRGGDYNKVQLSYEIAFQNSGFKPHVEFEMSSCPLRDKSRFTVDSSILAVQSIIGEMLDKRGDTLLTRRFGLEPFSVRCLSPEKTLCDKISRMIRVSYNEDPVTSLVQYIRDAYDMAMFMADRRFPRFLASPAFLEKMYVTNLEDRMRANSHALENYADAVVFAAPDKIFSKPEVKDAYGYIVENFVFNPGKAPRMEDVILCFTAMLPAMEEFEKYRKEQDNGMGGAGGSGGGGSSTDDGVTGIFQEDAIQEGDRAALLSLGMSEEQINRLHQDGTLRTDSHNYRPAAPWDTNVPKDNSAITFSFHDGKVFVRHPDGKSEKPVRDVVRNKEDLARFSSKKKGSQRQGRPLSGPRKKPGLH